MLSTEYPIYQQIAQRLLLLCGVPFFHAGNESVDGADDGSVQFVQEQVFAAGKSAGGCLKQTEVRVGNVLKKIRFEPVIDVGLDEVEEAFGLPIETGKRDQIRLVLDVFGRVALLEPGEETGKDTGIFDAGDASGRGVARQFGV